MLYRKANEKDLKQLSEIRWNFYYENRQIEENVIKNEFLNNCYEFLKSGLDSDDWVYWIAEDKNRIVSQIFIRKIRKVPKPSNLNGVYGYMTNVYTKPDCRNKGIGSHLLEKVKKWAININLELIIVWPSESSINYYEKAGFTNQNDVMEYIITE